MMLKILVIFLYDLVEKIIKNKNWKIKEIINQIYYSAEDHMCDGEGIYIEKIW